MGCDTTTISKKYLVPLIAVITAVVVCAGCYALANSSGPDYSSAGDNLCGDNLQWNYDGENHTLTISIIDATQDISAMDDYSETENAPWYSYRDEIKVLVLPEGLTTVGNYAFCECTAIESVEIPDTVTTIGESAFSGCTAVASMDLSVHKETASTMLFSAAGSNSSKLNEIKANAFSGCTGLTAITIPSSVTTIDTTAFTNCSSLKNVYCSSVTIKPDEYGISGATVHTATTITWENYDENVLYTESVACGTVPVYSGETPVKTLKGYDCVFSGWDPAVTMAGADAIYTAQFTETAHTTAITFDTKGGSEVDGTTFTFNQAVGELPTTSLMGYEFKGWYLDENYTIEITSSTTWEVDSETAILYAKWEARSVTISFDTNGGTLSGEETATMTYGTPFEFDQTATRTGYTFDGWYTDTSYTTKIETGKYTWTGSDDAPFATLYAKWIAHTTAITFDTKGGSEIAGTTFTYAQAVGELPTTSRTGYDFKGWYLDENYTTEITSSTTWNVDAETATLYAKWEARSVTVSFDANGGTLSGEETATMTYGTPFEFDQTATRTGYTFDGWYTDTSYTTKIETGEYTWTGSDDAPFATLYAKWEANTYTVTFYNGDDVYATIEETYGSAYVLPDDPTPKDYYDFDGWYTEKDGKGTMITGETIFETAGDCSLYAYFTPYTYEVHFNANGGTLNGDEDADVTYGVAFEFTQTATRTGYTFLGWYTEETDGVKISSGDVWTITENTTLYAHWEEKSSSSSGIPGWVIWVAIIVGLFVALNVVGFFMKGRKKKVKKA